MICPYLGYLTKWNGIIVSYITRLIVSNTICRVHLTLIVCQTTQIGIESQGEQCMPTQQFKCHDAYYNAVIYSTLAKYDWFGNFEGNSCCEWNIINIKMLLEFFHDLNLCPLCALPVCFQACGGSNEVWWYVHGPYGMVPINELRATVLLLQCPVAIVFGLGKFKA